ncbi:hypothetical protein N825_24715 [Skermanella stibiiresistens SB22]|uniref:Uncharacterized protein n=1 Tax=Skermanella stibiiresistens SB22 TaxID=1385369 RepID=W9H6T6_9PROT|nr:hypothetical protein [Skermanella stibiiresistens]EWY41739.1 hypothetical protein N825_24715 [Skermanella stibiiresistens SB22]
MSGVWRVPAALAALSLVALASAIVGDGLWHWVCWIGLSAPLLACAINFWRQWPGRERRVSRTGA